MNNSIVLGKVYDVLNEKDLFSIYTIPNLEKNIQVFFGRSGTTKLRLD